MMIKAPVEQQCAGYGLKGCDRLVDGIIMYVDGDKPGAVHKLKEGAAKNSPEQIRPFAKSLKELVPGQAGAEIAEILSGEIGPEKVSSEVASRPNPYQPSPGAAMPSPTPSEVGAKAPPAPDASRSTARLEHVELALVAPVDPSRLVTESASPRATGPVQSVCEIAGGNGTCVRKPTGGPLVITDAVTPVGCKNEVFIGAGDEAGHLGWFAQTNFPGIHGARFLVKSDQALTFVVRGAAPSKEIDARCVVTWAGFRPRIVPFTLGPSTE
jgi:hypothetical protein